MRDDENPAAFVPRGYVQQRTPGPVQITLPALGAGRGRGLRGERRDRASGWSPCPRGAGPPPRGRRHAGPARSRPGRRGRGRRGRARSSRPRGVSGSGRPRRRGGGRSSAWPAAPRPGPPGRARARSARGRRRCGSPGTPRCRPPRHAGPAPVPSSPTSALPVLVSDWRDYRRGPTVAGDQILVKERSNTSRPSRTARASNRVTGRCVGRGAKPG